jgi:acyl-CoA synthetase (AMP-forming)/AMP-acid ligase II
MCRSGRDFVAAVFAIALAGAVFVNTIPHQRACGVERTPDHTRLQRDFNG